MCEGHHSQQPSPHHTCQVDSHQMEMELYNREEISISSQQPFRFEKLSHENLTTI